MQSIAPRRVTRCLLRPEDVAPRFPDCEVIGAFNPAAVEFDGQVVLMVRIAERPRETRAGHVALPFWDFREGRLAIDWRREEEVVILDPRIVRVQPGGVLRLTFISWLLVAISRDGLSIDEFADAALVPETRYEAFGVEDPRLTKIDDRYYLTYVAVSEHGIATALASTADFRTFQKHGIIFCPENKDVLLFPETIDGQYVALHRPSTGARFSAPEIWIARSPDLIHWGQHERLLGSEAGWATVKIGGGTPPVRTDRGWLTLFHGHIEPHVAGAVGEYSAAAMLLDLAQPGRIVGLTSEPLMTAEADFEHLGFLPDIVFPTALVPRGDEVDVYYGAADTATGVVRYGLADLLARVTFRGA